MIKNVAYENLNLANASFFDDYATKFKNMMEKGWYILGKEVSQFEESFAHYIGTKYCVGVASGLDALILALMALELPPKSEVIIAANAYVACILSIIKANLVPILVEPDENSNIDVSKIEDRITNRTKVIMPVHLFGYPCDMDPIISLAQKYHLHIIEDCAQAHGARYFDKKAGLFSSISAFSFYPTKNLGALGDAGALLTHDENLYHQFRALRNYGSHIKYKNDYIGMNSRLDEIQAGFLSIKLPYLDKINEHKRFLASLYDKHLDERFQKPKHKTNFYGVYHIYNIHYSQRDILKEYLKNHGITTEIHYPIPPYRQKAYLELFDPNLYPISDQWHATTLSLPISFAHDEKDILYVCKIMNQFLVEEQK